MTVRQLGWDPLVGRGYQIGLLPLLKLFKLHVRMPWNATL